MNKFGAPLSLPWPPSVNHYWVWGRGHFRVSATGEKFRWLVFAAVRKAKLPKITGPVKLHFDAWPPDERKRDLDNILKALLDALGKAGLYDDDFQVADLSIRRRSVVPGGRVEVKIRAAALAKSKKAASQAASRAAKQLAALIVADAHDSVTGLE